MDFSTPAFPLQHQLSEFTQTHVHWVGDAIQLSHPVIPFSSLLKWCPASFQMGQFFTSSGQNIGVPASASVLPMNIQHWFPLRLTGLLAVQGTLKSLLQHHNSKASILQHSLFFMVQFSHPYVTTVKTIALTRWTFV